MNYEFKMQVYPFHVDSSYIVYFWGNIEYILGILFAAETFTR